jgi:hypothetical protein
MKLRKLACLSTFACSQLAVLLLLSFVRSASADPGGTSYEGWIWETDIYTDFGFTEEWCFGQINLAFSPTLTWSTNNAGTVDVCWGRETTGFGRSLINFPFTSDPSDAQSTRPLVSAGGNLYELFGEELVGGIGQGEERIGTLLSSSADNLLILGSYQTFTTSFFSIEEYRFVDLFVSSTPSVKAARNAADLVGTSWRTTVFAHGLDPADENFEAAGATVASFDLQAGGTCAQPVSSVFPDFTSNADAYTASQVDDGDSFDDRFVAGGLVPGTSSACSYAIDADDYLVVTRTVDGNSFDARFVVSDDNRFLINAPAVNIDESPQSLFVGFRAASAMATSAIDGTYLFYLPVTDFHADGAGAVAAGLPAGDWQENDGLGRGKIVFDSSRAGITPAGESGNWFSCDIEMLIHNYEHDLTGSVSAGTVFLGPDSGPDEGNVWFSDCDYQLDSDGGLRLYLYVPDSDPGGGFEGILRGYVNDNGEVFALLVNQIEEDPLNLANENEGVAATLFALGMRYTGDPAADNDADGISNFSEFKIPLPFTTTQGDLNDDGRSDILWRNASTGQNWLYLMNGPTISDSVGINQIPAVWNIVGNGDYNGDGSTDILWRHSVTGQNWMYLMNGAFIVESLEVNNVPTVWQVVGNGDYDGDGDSDILWRHSITGQNWLYLMSGADISVSHEVNTVPTDWNIAGSGDYNGDGNSDILWRHSVTGQNWMYLMNGPSISSSLEVNTVPTIWDVVGNGDYNGDGSADILWRHSVTGQNWMYLMNGANISSSLEVNTVPTIWSVIGDGDYNGDGRADILWRHGGTGQNWMYLMDGAMISSSTGVNTVVDPNWQVVNTD